jgi:hypothetical protein
LKPSLVIGISEEVFWKQTPKTILIYFEAEEERNKKRMQEIWMIGAYMKRALSSTILVSTLADKNTAQKMPKFPDCPYQEKTEINLTEEQKQYERMRLVQYLNRFSKK